MQRKSHPPLQKHSGFLYWKYPKIGMVTQPFTQSKGLDKWNPSSHSIFLQVRALQRHLLLSGPQTLSFVGVHGLFATCWWTYGSETPNVRPYPNINLSWVKPQGGEVCPSELEEKHPLNFSLRTSKKKQPWHRTGICQMLTLCCSGVFRGVPNPEQRNDRVLGSFGHCGVTRAPEMRMEVEPPCEWILTPTPVRSGLLLRDGSSQLFMKESELWCLIASWAEGF